MATKRPARKPKVRSVSDELAALGFSHRKAGPHVDGREVFRTSDGFVVGTFHAADAVRAVLAFADAEAA